ncbi:ras GTPase-activating-like protein IQGAP2 [Corvus kubaryi]|uniref:ras GTPase-activating-like protein IQGAP2 n=1 Tax=Corvus kubaryi TaxID=68294 RepID=UPI001C04D1F4|nr:ras GTPase-activating-like protein IQGAP2 [Corvus kubaryi]
MEVCLDEELPPTTELEEGLRNGVYLAKLAKFFAPNVVSDKKIYDAEQSRYKRSGLHFRHTDNTVQWLRAMESIGLPKVTSSHRASCCLFLLLYVPVSLPLPCFQTVLAPFSASA